MFSLRPLAEKLKILFEKLGTEKQVVDFYMDMGEKLDSHTIKKHKKKLLNEGKYMRIFKGFKNKLEILGDSFYEQWDKNNS